MFDNKTRNQHFLPQVEQRLNSLNPSASKKNQKIYSFKIKDRENYLIEPDKPAIKSISNNLSVFDIFSFDVSGSGPLRSNLESFFGPYENEMESNTNELLRKVRLGNDDIQGEIVNIFAGKLLNFVRNPYCVTKILNTLLRVPRYRPTDPDLYEIYKRIKNGSKPHRDHVCKTFGITGAIYDEWLSCLFMLVTPTDTSNGLNLFDIMVKAVLEDKEKEIFVHIFDYDDGGCLLSDRGYCQPVADSAAMTALSFNLCSNAFIDYVFVSAQSSTKNRISKINVALDKNNFSALRRYNRRVVDQCHTHVYCCKKDGISL